MLRIRPALLLPATALALLLLVPSGGVVSQELRRVLVTNFPSVQTVDGEVSVSGAVRLSELVTFNEIIVPPVAPSETTRLVEAGVLSTSGFPKVVLSLHGQVKGSVHRVGEVGTILVPNQSTIQEAFNEQGLVHFAMRAAAPGISSSTPYFASNQPSFPVGFQSYKVLLYNTTDKTVTVNLFAYLTN